jgi:hypothetical protein
MPEKETIERAEQDKREGKAPTTQAGEFVREEIHHVREGKHGARSPEQAIAIGLSKARKAGVKLPAPPKGTASEEKQKGHRRTKRNRPSAKRSRATSRALKREPRSSASRSSLGKHARSSARRRSSASRSGAARKAANTRRRTARRSR